jgi:undecaprenyl diphosphate synthase
MGDLDPERLDEKTFASFLYSPDIPDPDLLIRTGGECRVSNFLLWQIAYSEIYTTPVMWPDFRESNYKEAVLDYQLRERRFGLTSAQVDNLEPRANGASHRAVREPGSS